MRRYVFISTVLMMFGLGGAGAAFAADDEGGISVPKGLKLKIGGRLYIDAAKAFSEDNISVGSGADIGAARMRVEGQYGDWGFQLQYDFTDSGARGVKFAYLRYTGFKFGDMPTAITLGNQFEQFGMENRISSKYVTFIDQSLPFAAIGVGPRHLGLAWTGLKGPFHWGVGVYGEEPGSETNSAGGDSNGIDYATRLAYDPVATSNRLLHFEGSARYHKYNGETSIGNRNDSILGAHAIYPSNDLFPVLIAARAGGSNPDNMTNYNLGFAAVYDGFHTEAEYYRTEIDGLEGVGESSVTFDGYYAQVGWFLTGESRRFVRSAAHETFVGTAPKNPLDKGGKGAWEIAARYSEADLSDGNLGSRAGKERDITLGINWTPVKYVRFLLNYSRMLPIEGGSNDDKSFDTVAFRTIVYW